MSDYYGVDPKLGTFDDFLTCIRTAGARGLRVMIDLVMDHSSDQHPWFQAARRDRHSRYRRYSLLNWMKRLITVRRQCPEWGWGVVRVIETDEPGLFAHECQWKGNRLLAFHNLAAKSCSARLPRERDSTLLPLLGTVQPDFSHPSSLLEMAAYGFLWLRLTPRHE